MEFVVNLLSGSTVKLVKGFWTALSIKQEVAKRCSAQTGQLRLLHAGEELLDHGSVLADYNGEPVQLDCVRQAENMISPHAQSVVLLSRELWLEHVETFCIGFTKCRSVLCDNACLRFAPLEMCDDKDVVMTAATRCPGAFRYASQRLRSDLAFVTELLSKAPEAADYVDSTLHLDPGVLRVLAKLWLPRVFESSDMRSWGGLPVPTALQMNKAFVIEALEGLEYVFAIGPVASFFHNDYDVVTVLVEKDGLNLRYAAGWLCDDRDIVMAAVSQVGCALQYASNRLRADCTVVMMAASNNWRALEFADDELLNDSEVIKSALCPGLIAAITGRRAHWGASALYRALCRRGLVLTKEDAKDVPLPFDEIEDETAVKADSQEAPQGKYGRRLVRQQDAKRRQAGRERRSWRKG